MYFHSFSGGSTPQKHQSSKHNESFTESSSEIFTFVELPHTSIQSDQGSKYISKFDLLKGYWQVSLTEWAKKVSAFATPDGLYQYYAMPFGMKNAFATFQQMINRVIASLEGVKPI